MEEWRDIPRYEGIYEASSKGRVRSCPRWIMRFGRKTWDEGRVLSQVKGRAGGGEYYAVRLSKFGKAKIYRVHRLVASAFYGEIPSGMLVRHLNGNSLDNRAENLRIGEYRENWRDCVAHGTASVGEKHTIAKLTERDVKEIRRLLKKGVSQQKIAERFNVAQTNISHINTGKSWRRGYEKSGVDERSKEV